jgi:hypothetical protein
VQTSISKGYEGGLSVGQRQFWVRNGSGPTSAPTGASNADTILVPPGQYLDEVSPCLDTTGTILAIPFPSAVGTTRATWKFLYYTAVGMTLATGNLSTYNFQFGTWGGEF